MKYTGYRMSILTAYFELSYSLVSGSVYGGAVIMAVFENYALKAEVGRL